MQSIFVSICEQPVPRDDMSKAGWMSLRKTDYQFNCGIGKRRLARRISLHLMLYNCGFISNFICVALFLLERAALVYYIAFYVAHACWMPPGVIRVNIFESASYLQ